MDYFSKLPPELVLQILKFVPSSDVYCKFRYLSKKFNSIVDILRPNSLTAISKYMVEKDSRLKYHDLVIINDEDLFFEVCPLRFKNVKKLKIELYGDFLLKVNDFYNQFTEVEEMKCRFINIKESIYINLKKLKKFSVLYKGVYEMNTPELVDLTCANISGFNLHYPMKIKKIKIESYRSNDEDAECLLKLTNLEELIFINDLFIVENSLLERLTNLKRVEVKLVYANNKYDITYRRDGLKLLFNGIDADHFNSLMDEFDYHLRFQMNDDVLNYILKHYSEIEIMDSYYRLYYAKTEYLIDDLPQDFHNKIRKITSIIIDKKVDECKLLNFMENCRPTSLEISKIALSPFFFKQLGCRDIYIRSMKMEICNNNNQNYQEMQEEFKFVFQIKTLEYLNLKYKCCYFYYYKWVVNFFLNSVKYSNFIDEIYIHYDDDKYKEEFILRYLNENQGTDEYVEIYAENFYSHCISGEIYFRNKFQLLNFLKYCKNCKNISNTKDFIHLLNEIKYLDIINKSMVKKLSKQEILYIDQKLLPKFID